MVRKVSPTNPSAPAPSTATPPEADDPELSRVVGEEERCLDRVLARLDARAQKAEAPPAAYDRELLELRDLIAAARMEDVPPLIEEMERLQSLAARRRSSTNETWVDAKCPYFGHLVLKEGQRRRDVLIGRATYLDTDSGVRIVDWRDAPVSRLYYRYEEGDEYDEVFGDRRVEGEVMVRRATTIVERELKRVVAPQGSFAKRRAGTWERLGGGAARLAGGQGAALRAEAHHRPGKLGVGTGETNDDKHLREITALIDPRQFELITRSDSGLVVIQGGAGSGKTTIGLHRLAYLAFQDKRRFRPDRMLVIVFNDALARYISMVLPALDVAGVGIRTYEDWAAKLRLIHCPRLPTRYSDETPLAVTRLKKHPALLDAIDAHLAGLESRYESELRAALGLAADSEPFPAAKEALSTWHSSTGSPLCHRLHAMESWLNKHGKQLRVDIRVAVDRWVVSHLKDARDVVGHWAELLCDRDLLAQAFQKSPILPIAESDFNRALSWCMQRCSDALADLEARLERVEEALAEPDNDNSAQKEKEEEQEPDFAHGVDGREVEERTTLDREDDAILLRLYQKLRGPLMRGAKGKEALIYEHVLIDEAQDLSPVELSVVLGTVSKAQSITLAGDVAQRLHMDNGFTTWETVLGNLGLAHVEVEPLRLSYRSTHEIMQFARTVLGPLAPAEEPVATRSGAPVDLFSFGHGGDSVAFLTEALRDLTHSEPRASIAVVARYPEHADAYYEGLRKGELAHLRRIARQDFPFKPGIDVTDIRQVKGLEFDYVVLVEVSESSYPADDEARHLLHIGATRAAHQLWILATGKPSPLLPQELLDRSY